MFLFTAINYPFYGSQFHPEKNQFEWTLAENIDHSYQAIEAMQYFANFFINQGKHSTGNHRGNAILCKLLYQSRSAQYRQS